MDINATLLGQMISFILFAIFTMKYVWPPIMDAIEKRQKVIQQGLDASKKGQEELAKASTSIEEMFREANKKSQEIFDNASSRADSIVEKAKEKAKAEQALQLKKAADEIEQMKRKAELELKKNVVDLAVLASEKILDANIDKKANEQLLNNLVEDLKA